MIENKELISVVVAVYNSEEFIEETLESIYAQTYGNIELVICDDCSSDKTIEVIDLWIQNIEKHRFSKINIIKKEKNVGLTKNINFGVKSSHGKWIKCLGGDDILTTDCLDVLHSTAKLNRGDIAFGEMNYFYTDKYGSKILVNSDLSNEIANMFKLSQKDFFNALIKKSFLPAPSAFFSKKIWIELNGFDERYLMVEDWPFWLKAAEKNTKMSFIDKVVVLYREHEGSITSKKLETINDDIGIQARLDIINFSYNFRRKYISNVLEKWEIINLFYTIKIPKNKSPLSKTIYYLLRITSPIYIKNVIKSKIDK